MPMPKIIGLVGLVLGAVLLAIAWQASNAPIEQLAETLSGRYTNSTMWYLITGVAAVVGGGALFLFGNRTA